MTLTTMTSTIRHLIQSGRGILAADESTSTIAKRFASIQVECTELTRRDYREALFTAPQLNQFISGVILYEETLTQKAQNGAPFYQLLLSQGILPGIKVDKGLIECPNARGEKITTGLDGLAERLAEYQKFGAAFAKWRAVFTISDRLPSELAIHINAERLAHYAALCQNQQIVPIVEPEVLMDGHHSIERCAEVTETVLRAVFAALYRYRVDLAHIILKPSMVVPGSDCTIPTTTDRIAELTLQVLRRTVPAAVPSINFLSGGQSDEAATANLQAINASPVSKPWNLSYSYGRALQNTALKAWAGKRDNTTQAQYELIQRARLNSAAALGK